MLSLCIYLVKDVLGTGADPKISERGGRKPNPRKGGGGSRNSTFQCGFQSFSYKSLTNIPTKGGAAARPAPPLNPRLGKLREHSRSEWIQKHKASPCVTQLLLLCSPSSDMHP